MSRHFNKLLYGQLNEVYEMIGDSDVSPDDVRLALRNTMTSVIGLQEDYINLAGLVKHSVIELRQAMNDLAVSFQRALEQIGEEGQGNG